MTFRPRVRPEAGAMTAASRNLNSDRAKIKGSAAFVAMTAVCLAGGLASHNPRARTVAAHRHALELLHDLGEVRCV